MFPAGLITFRETLEIALVIGIILTTLARTNQTAFSKRVWQGVIAGLSVALLAGFFIHALFRQFTGPKEAIFEGTLMFITAGLLTWMILWVHRQDDVRTTMEESVSGFQAGSVGSGIFFLSLLSVLREGIEAVLYLQATSFSESAHILLGAGAGILIALTLGYALFSSAYKVDLSRVFSAVNVLLVLFAAGLMAHGVHEFQEVGWLPTFAVDPLFDITGILSDEGALGGFLNSLFGYFSAPTVLQAIAYVGYIISVVILEKKTTRMLVKR